MSSTPSAPGPQPLEEPAVPPAKPAPPVDEVAAAKVRLLAASETHTVDTTAKVNGFLRDHPYLSATAALGVGLLVARVSTLRKLATVGGMWAAKRYLTRYLSRMGR
ncbi:MAG: hypothetical protein WD534_14090 [Phycisphaeraceae bacterium]